MKNKLSIIWLIIVSILFSPVVTHGSSSSCSIENEAADSLTNYIKNVRKAVTNTNKSLLWKIDKKNTSKLSITWNQISRIYSETINWDGFYTDFSYYLTFPMLNDIPNPIHRDLSILENETDWLRSYLETLVWKWYSWVSLDKDEVCNWVENCNLQWDAISIIWKIIKNNTQITTLYKQIVTNPNQEHSLDTILTIEWSEWFIAELITHYWWTTIEDCGKSEDAFGDRIEKAKQAILLNDKVWRDWIQKWKDAWKLLVWSSDSENYQKIEHDLLKKELARQWLSTSAQQVLLNNLKEFNAWDQWLDNNFITKSFGQIYQAGVKIWNGFSEAIDWLLDEEDTQEINKNASVGINKLLWVTQKENITNNIEKRLDILYRTHIEYASIESYSTLKLQWDVINMHDKIKNSSKILRNTCELAVKVCNDQWRWKWNCWSCK
jgi:hypothetical protein